MDNLFLYKNKFIHIFYDNFIFVILCDKSFMHLLSFKVVLEKQRLFYVYVDVYDVHKLANDHCVCCVVVLVVFIIKMVVIIYLFIWYVIN